MWGDHKQQIYLHSMTHSHFQRGQEVIKIMVLDHICVPGTCALQSSKCPWAGYWTLLWTELLKLLCVIVTVYKRGCENRKMNTHQQYKYKGIHVVSVGSSAPEHSCSPVNSLSVQHSIRYSGYRSWVSYCLLSCLNTESFLSPWHMLDSGLRLI